MSAGKIVTYIVAVILILIGLGLAVIIGLSYIVQAGNGGSVVTGSIFLIIGFILIVGGSYLIYLAGRSKMGAVTENVTYKVDLPANVNMDTLKCKSCGGTLTMDNIQMVAGAPVVNCPYCHTTYQLTEEPKW
jgi:ascorbate-specific PTS system EIIC-type component UlaA